MCWSAELIFRFSSHYFPPFLFLWKGERLLLGVVVEQKCGRTHFVFLLARNLVVHTLYSIFFGMKRW